MPPRPEESLDPPDWTELRVLGHRMVDDMMDYLEGVRERPVWQSGPARDQGGARRADAPWPGRSGGGLPAVPRSHPALSQRQHSSAILGLGHGDGDAARHAGRHAGLGDERAPRRVRPVSGDRGAAGDSLDGGAARISGGFERPVGERRRRSPISSAWRWRETPVPGSTSGRRVSSGPVRRCSCSTARARPTAGPGRPAS